MEYIAVTFRSRSHTIKFAEFLRRNGIYGEIINTPKEAGVGCGLSVKIKISNFVAVKKAVGIAGLTSFAGFFLVKIHYGRRTVRSI